jgi:hypothetical protein
LKWQHSQEVFHWCCCTNEQLTGVHYRSLVHLLWCNKYYEIFSTFSLFHMKHKNMYPAGVFFIHYTGYIYIYILSQEIDICALARSSRFINSVPNLLNKKEINGKMEAKLVTLYVKRYQGARHCVCILTGVFISLLHWGQRILDNQCVGK